MKIINDGISGLFYKDSPKIRAELKKDPATWGPHPPITNTGWRTPDFPNLSAARVLGVDTETYDPELKTAGPGWARGSGHIVGVSIAVQDGTSWYFPMRHGLPVDGGPCLLGSEHTRMNMNPDTVLRWLNEQLGTNIPKVGANLIYDVGWLRHEGVGIKGPFYDIQYAEALLNSETPDVSLESLAQKYLGQGKVTEELYEWLAAWNGKKADSEQRKYMYITPPTLAGPYAESDASLPIKILNKQWPLLEKRGVLDLFKMECDLTEVLVAMRQKGAPVNLDKAEKLHHTLGLRIDEMTKQLNDMVGFEVNTKSPSSMTKAFNVLGLDLSYKLEKFSKEKKLSFDKSRLKQVNHPFTDLVLAIRGSQKTRDVFIGSYILEKNVNGRIHCLFHPLKSDEGGTRSGRLASSLPNLQNIPVRTEEGKLIREIFDGTIAGLRWRSFDYSSIEYRLLAHFATGPKADEIREIYRNDPRADYHQIVNEMIKRVTGLDIGRGNSKTINFGIIYGQQLPALSAALKLEKAAAAELLATYHRAAPYASATMDACAAEANNYGMVRTILNRASDFNSWAKKGYDEERLVLSYEDAVTKWGSLNIERSSLHKALNRKLQGSAADVMKKAMVDAYKAGLFEESACGMPVLTVHDELDFEDKNDLDNPAWAELVSLLENGMAGLLKVPLIVDGNYGNTWADAH